MIYLIVFMLSISGEHHINFDAVPYRTFDDCQKAYEDIQRVLPRHIVYIKATCQEVEQKDA